MPVSKSKSKLSHFSDAGAAHMVDVGAKPASKRKAIAQGRILMRAATLAIIESGQAQKGDVLGIARIAAIMACKRTADLIPLCHPLALSHASVEFSIETQTPAVYCQMRVETTGPTGVEMEALTGVQVALLTIYDMCKAVDKDMVISDIALLEKYGGKSGDWIAQKHTPKT